MNSKVKLFSHTDLDGYGCNVIIKSLVGINSDCENLNYDKINERVKEYFINKEYKEYIITYITDISVNGEVAEIIDNIYKEEDIRIILFDHHPTALSLNKYTWAKVETERDGEKTSGTKMLYDDCKESIEYLNDANYINKDSLLDFVENVRKYDTRLWKEKYNDIKPKQFNDLFYILGTERFIDKIVHGVKYASASINDFIEDNKILLELQQEKIDKYIEAKNKELIDMNLVGYKVGIIFAEQFQSELGNRLSEMNPQFDLIIMIGNKTISYRTVKDNVNCGDIAKLFGGGGHPKASGSQISTEKQMIYIKELFK
jgi:oligoribonuclease NrnB/cAMP/cGMP phosphodiesterase (DHH superfamily)